MAAISDLTSRSANVAVLSLHMGAFRRKRIIPDIFGSMIQAVRDEERGELGLHSTSVPNILKGCESSFR